jgi:hypothetical protein
MSKLIKAFVSPGLAMSVSICAINLYNMKRSPIYENDGSANARIVGGILVKSALYSTLWPITGSMIAYDIHTEAKDVDRHFIPFSVYGHS